MRSSENIISLEDKYGANNYNPLPIVISEAEGIWVEDPEGNRYIDMLSSYSAVSHGHSHPEIVKTLKEQSEKLALTSRAFYNNRLGSFYKKLAEVTGKDMFLPMNTGTEAVETALKMARRWGYYKKGIPKNKAEIITCSNNFHGRTISIITFSTSETSRDGYGPYLSGFKVIEYGSIEKLKDAINPNTAAFLVEPIQGEGGIIIPPNGYLKEAYEVCQENDVLFMADEVQTGFGRTGKMFGCDWEDVKPDVYILGKALGGGVFPVSAVGADEEIMEVFDPGSHGSTFGGNPLGSAVATRAIELLKEENMVKNSREMGKYLLEKLKEIENPVIKEIRGRGLFIGIELKEKARPYCKKLKENGVLVKETHGNIIRTLPPLIINKEEIDEAVRRIKKVL